MFSNFYSRVKTTYLDYLRPFWILMMSSLIDRTGGAIMFTFFALYVTVHFNVGMKEVGVIFIIWSITGMIGNFVAGALTDRWGRKKMLLFGLSASALSSLGMAMIDDLTAFYILTVFVGLVANAGGPAQQAMVADLLPEEQRTEGFGIWRIVANVAVAIGPAIGGFLAGYSFLYIFLGDTITSLITAVIVFIWIPETKPELTETEEKKEESMWQSYARYLEVFKDGAFISFLLAMILVGLAYLQMYSTLSVFLVKTHGEPATTYGYILSINAAIVVLAQFAVTKKIKNRPPMLVLVAGCLFYAVGFGMYGFVATFPLFVLAMIVITIGEMLHAPISQSIATKLAPEDMRGRYMAIFGLSFMIPNAIGPYLAGVLMDDFNPLWVWYAAGILSAISALIFVGLHAKQKDAFKTEPVFEPEAAPAD